MSDHPLQRLQKFVNKVDNPADPRQRYGYNITGKQVWPIDFYTNYDDIKNSPIKVPNQTQEIPKTWLAKMRQYLIMHNPHHFIFLILLGTLTATVGFVFDKSVDFVTDSKTK